jgi:hypothetical protein
MASSDRNNVIFATIVARAWEDDGFRKSLVDDPTGLCREEGMDFPEDTKIDLRENTPHSTHLVLPAEDCDESISQLGELIKACLPLPTNHSLVIVQNQATLLHLVLPVNPRDVNVELTDEDLEALAAAGVTTVSSNVFANSQVAANAVVAVNAAVAHQVAVATFVIGPIVLILYPFSAGCFEFITSRISLKTNFSPIAS